MGEDTRRRLLLGIALTAVVILGAGRSVSARVWQVKQDGSGDTRSIQTAIEAAQDGDMIEVSPGVYMENINLRGKAVYLRSSMGPEVTTIDGSALDSSVVTMTSGESPNTILEGFRITGGRGVHKSQNIRRGGGIYCFPGTPTIRNNIIVENTAGVALGYSSWGGGILIAAYSGSETAIVEGNTIEGNFAASNAGGAWIEAACDFLNNTVRGNSTGTGDGAGLYVLSRAANVHGNLFTRNLAGDHGGAIYISNEGDSAVPASSLVLSDNLIIGNKSDTKVANDCSGGGIWLYGDATIAGNTIAFNKSMSLSEMPAGGICITWILSAAIVERNIIAYNGGGGMSIQAVHGQLDLRENLFYDNDGVDLQAADSSLVTMTSNVFTSPMFCRTGPDSRGELAGLSPALRQAFGVIGAVDEPSCGPNADTSVKRTTWGALKGRYLRN